MKSSIGAVSILSDRQNAQIMLADALEIRYIRCTCEIERGDKLVHVKNNSYYGHANL